MERARGSSLGLPCPPNSVLGDKASALADRKAAPTLVAITKPADHTGGKPPQQFGTRIASIAHFGRLLALHIAAGLAGQEPGHHPTLRAIGIAHKAPAFLDPQHFQWQQRTLVDPDHPVVLTRSSPHVYLAGLDRGPIWGLGTILGQHGHGQSKQGNDGKESAKQIHGAAIACQSRLLQPA